MMKKTLALSAVLVVGLSAFASAATLSLPNVLDDPTPHNWGYTENNNIEVVGFNVEEGLDPTIAEKDFVIKTPVLSDEKNQEVQEYTIFLSKYPVKHLLAGDKMYEYRDSGMFLPLYRLTDLAGKAELRIPAVEQGIEKTNYYYGFVVPNDNNGDIGDRSMEFCFNFSTEEFNYGEACSTFGPAIPEPTPVVNAVETTQEEELHGAAGADMGLADISHTVDFTGKVITLTWTHVPGSEFVRIQLFDHTTKSYKDIATVNMLDEKYEYHYDGSIEEYIFAFIPESNPGKEYRYDLNVRRESPEKSVEIKEVPNVGPVEDMLLIFGVAVFLYGGYVALRSSKAKVRR